MRLLIAPAALAELQSAVDFYAAHASKPVGQLLLDDFERATSLLMLNPSLGAVRSNGRRTFALRRFPYNIIYQPTTDLLRIIALAHQRRRPAYWGKRK
jgi:plasmid stabilization system protein ParE